MNTPASTAIRQLAELQALDRARREKTKIVEELELEIARLQEEIRSHQEAVDALDSELAGAESRRRELETLLEIEGTRMKDRRMRLNRVRNEKELLALRHEIEVGKEANQQVEEEILALFEKIDELGRLRKEAEEALARVRMQGTARIEESRQRIEALRAEIDRARGGRAALASALDPDLLKRYEQIFERRAGIAVVEARGGVCTGCHRNLPPQFYNELQRSADVRSCPSCHRILFWQPETLETSEVES